MEVTTPAAPAASEAATAAQTPTPASEAAQAPPPADPAKPDAAAPAPAEPAPEPAAEPKDDPVSTRFAALARRERQIVEREASVKAGEKELAEYRKARDNAKLDPMAFLEAHGITFDDLSKFVLNDRKLTEAQRLQLLEDRIRAEDEAKARQTREEAQAKIESVFNETKQEIRSFVDSDPDAYELIRANDAHELVFEVIRQRFEETEEILPIQAAAGVVEAHLEKLAREKILNLKRFQPKAGATSTDDAQRADPATQTAPAKDKEPAPTLTNAATASAPQPASQRELTDEESIERAASMLRWKE